MDKVVAPGGKHFILELDRCPSDLLRDSDRIQAILEEAAVLGRATVLFSRFYHFGGEYGVTGVIGLSESHITIHTWPEEQYAAVDIFMCGTSDPLASALFIIKMFECESVVRLIERQSFRS